MSDMIIYIFRFMDSLLQFYIWILIASIILTWLIHFNILNMSNQAVYKIGMFLQRVTEPVYAPIRQFLPSIAGLDFSPIVVFFLIGLIRVGLSHVMIILANAVS